MPAIMNNRGAWLEHIEQEIEECGEDSHSTDLHKIMRELLSSTSNAAASDAAHQFDTYYWQSYLPADPLRRFEDDKGIAGYLSELYAQVFELARLISYKDEKQMLLINLILELRKLPPKSFKIWNQEVMVYTRDPLWTVTMENSWNGNHASNIREAEQSVEEIKRLCDEWVNLSTFYARCIESGINERYEDGGCKYPGFGIPDAIEKDLQPGAVRDSQIMAATQYIILSGRGMYQQLILKPEKGSKKEEWGREKWQIWSHRFEELSELYERESNLDMAAITKESHDKMGLLADAASPR